MRLRCAVLLLLGFIATQSGWAVCLIRGTVLDAESGKPLSKTRVFAKPGWELGRPAILRTTDLQGAFCFDHLEPGTYQVAAGRPGYLSALYGAKPGGDQGIQLDVDGHAELPSLTLKLLRSASIAGTVVDSNGEPLEGLSVELDRKAWDKGWSPDTVNSTVSDDRGVFRFPLLAPGTYYVSVDPPDHDGTVLLDGKGQPIRAMAAQTFYNGSLTFARATPIPLKAGQDIANLFITISQVTTRHLSGSLSAALELTSDSKPTLFAQPEQGPGVRFDVRNDRTFSIDGLLPTKYFVKTWRGMKPAAQAEVDLANGDVEGIVIEPTLRFDIRMSPRVEGQSPNGDIQLQARDREKGDLQNGGPDAGSYLFRAVPPGIYQIETGRPGDNLYVKSLVIGGQPKSGATIDLRKGQPGTVEVLLSRNVAGIEGRVDLPEGTTPSFATTVVLLDEAKSIVDVEGDTATVDPAGRFKLESLAPGKYRVFAIEGFEEHLWGSLELAAALRDKSSTLELHEGEKRQLVAPVISPEEWTAALRKVGM